MVLVVVLVVLLVVLVVFLGAGSNVNFRLT